MRRLLVPAIATKTPSQNHGQAAPFALLRARNLVMGLATAMGLVLSLGIVHTVWAQDAGNLEGQVVNGTVGAEEIGAGLPATLHIYLGDAELETLETVTDADGRFRFEGLDTDPSLEYWPEVVYLEVPYSSAEPLQFENDQTTLPATLGVYETTEDDSAIRLSSVHMIAESFGEVLRLSEIHLYGNTGDRTYVGNESDAGQPTTVFIPLPEGAVGVAFGGGISDERFVEVEGGLLDTEPIVPGAEASLVFFSYHLIAGDDPIPLERRFSYPVTILNVLVAQPGLTLESEQLQSRGQELFQGRQYELHTAQNLEPGTPLRLALVPVGGGAGSTGVEGMPPAAGQGAASASATGTQGLLLWLGFGLAVVAVFGALVYSLATRRPAPVPEGAPELASNPRARQLLAELAELDEAFEAEEIGEAAYELQRVAIREELKAL